MEHTIQEYYVLEPYHFVRSKGVTLGNTKSTYRFGTLPFRKVKGQKLGVSRAMYCFGTLPFRKVKGPNN